MPQEIVTCSEGYKWVIRDESRFNNCMQDMLGAYPQHEPEMLALARNLSTISGVFVDIGAQVGYFSVRLSSYYPEILAFEPNPANIKVLDENIKLNKIKNIITHRIGLWNEEKAGVIFDRGGESILENLTQNKEPDNMGKYDVLLQRLDEIAYIKFHLKYKHVVIKIDTEGAELPILEGMGDILHGEHIALLIEHHSQMYGEDKKTGIINYLQSFGFHKVKDLSQHKIFLVKGDYGEFI